MTVVKSPLVTKSNATSPVVVTVNDKEESIEVRAGMKVGVKNLYQTEPDYRGGSTWGDRYPNDLEEAAENRVTARYALVIRRKKCYDGRKKLQIESIIVQSPLLKKVLGSVLKCYHGITTGFERLTFSAPFQPFVHRWSQLADAVKMEKDAQTKDHLDLLYKTLQGELEADIKARDDFILNGVITYDACWMIFEPGSLVFTSSDGHESALRLLNAFYISTERGRAYQLNCELVDWDGENFGTRNKSIKIWEFLGTAEITNLTVFPLEYHSEIDKVRWELISRGENFENLQGHHFKRYDGIAVGEGPSGPIEYNVYLFRPNTVSIFLLITLF